MHRRGLMGARARMSHQNASCTFGAIDDRVKGLTPMCPTLGRFSPGTFLAMSHGAMMNRAGTGGGALARVPGKLESKHKVPPPKWLNTFGKISRDLSGLEIQRTRAGSFVALRRWRADALEALQARLASDLPMPAHYRRAIADMDAGRSPRDVALALGMPLATCTRLRNVVHSRRRLGVAVKWSAARMEAPR